MKRIPLNAQTRSGVGAGINRRLRAKGKIPAILYGLKSEPIMFTLDRHEFTIATSKVGDEMVMYDLSVLEAGVKNQLSMIREVQLDPVTERITHIDMLRVDATKPIDVEIAVHAEGTAAGVREGGSLEHVMRTVHLRCLIDDIPDHISIDVSPLALGQAFHVSDLQLNERISILSNPKDVLFLVAVPRKEEVTTAAAAAEGEGAAAEGGEEKKGEEKGAEKKEEKKK